jgi:AraC-like DNA-binding protein
MFPSLEIRSYQGEYQHHSHAFAQVVLPVSGRMDIEVQGRADCLDPSLAAWVAPSAMHSQVAERSGRFLVLDCPADWLSEAALAALARQVYLPISESARRLIEFANLAGNASLVAHSAHLVPLLLGVLVDRTGHRPSGIEVLLARLEANPGAAWSNEAMARTAGLSVGQLHKRVVERFDLAPQALLSQIRMRHARKWLAESDLPIVDIALRSGYADQAAFTRAMSRLCGITPAACRAAARQPG